MGKLFLTIGLNREHSFIMDIQHQMFFPHSPLPLQLSFQPLTSYHFSFFSPPTPYHHQPQTPITTLNRFLGLHSSLIFFFCLLKFTSESMTVFSRNNGVLNLTYRRWSPETQFIYHWNCLSRGRWLSFPLSFLKEHSNGDDWLDR